MSQRQFRLFPERRDERRAAREAAMTRFDWNAVTAQLEAIYLEVMRKRGA
jgi:glycosyltransferase involved in cell wall biosynthesis